MREFFVALAFLALLALALIAGNAMDRMYPLPPPPSHEKAEKVMPPETVIPMLPYLIPNAPN